MTLVLEAAVLGILTGGVYALMASGLTLIFGVMRIINVGHGALVVLGAYLSFAAWRSLNLDPFLTLVITMPVMFLLGVVLQLVFIRPLKTDREALSVLVTYAIALGLEGILGYLFGTKTYNKDHSELIIFMTPHVIYDETNLLEASDELKARVRSMRKLIRDL